MKIALSMIVKASDAEAEVLRRCLSNIAPYVDGIFLTITGQNKACEDVAEMFNATVSHFEWINNFSAARNFAMAQVPKDYDYWMWLDCDDVVRGAETLRETIEAHPSVDAFIFNYLYYFDQWNNPVVVHMKTRVVRNDGCVEWRGAIHEDFHNTRAVDAKFVEGVEVLHLTDDDRVEDSKARNVIVAAQEAEVNPDDPRTYWNLGNALKASGKNEEAMEAMEKFMATSESDEEKYIVRIRMAEIYTALGDKQKALETAQMAVGMRPMYPDGYKTVANILYDMGRLNEAKEHIMMSLQLEPPYHKIIVYNPRDYDLEPLRMLAKIYLEMSLPQLALEALKACAKIVPKDEDLTQLIEKMEVESAKAESAMALAAELSELPDDELRAAFDEIDPAIVTHPSLCHLRNTRLIKEESSGKDLVFFCSHTDRVWTPDSLAEGIGGSEEAIIHLSKRLAARGWNVTVYNNCGPKGLEFDGVKFRPYWEWNYRDKQDVVVLWRHPKMLDYEINADKVLVDMHDVVPTGEYNEKRVGNMTAALFKSECHRNLYPQIPDDKCVVIPNGIVWDDFQEPVERDPYLLINTSSPDRGLRSLLDAFTKVKEQVPEAHMEWAYGWGVWDSVYGSNHDMMKWKEDVEKLMEETDGVTNLGRIGQHEVAELYKKAGIFAYPTAFFEIDCISARKAQAAGAFPVATDFAALNETIQYGVKVKTDLEQENWGKPGSFDFSLKEERAVEEWIAETVKALKNPQPKEDQKEMQEWTKKFDWENTTTQWENVIK
jgi:glycosyltransferase involved in cell wall biosynthesis